MADCSKNRKITAKQKRFVEEYIKHYNGTKAAIDAGFSKKTADIIAYQLLNKTLVVEYKEKLEKERAARADIEEAELIKFWKETMYNTNEKTIDRTKASELLGRTKGLFNDNLKIKAEVTTVLFSDENKLED